jgi:3-hydroxybutyrate dehydrogenase
MLAPAAIKELIDPDDIAKLASFLASEEARLITGSSYSIDAGWTAR